MLAIRPVAGLLAGLVVFASVTGCGRSTLPETCQVAGEVADAKGVAITQGVVRFQPEAAADLSIVGEIRPDGTFELRTLGPGAEAPGAPAGIYTVGVTAASERDRVAEILMVTQPRVTVQPGEASRLRIVVKRVPPPPPKKRR